jgi:hypothetical protein
MTNELSPVHLKIGNLFLALRADKDLTDEQVVKILRIPKRKLKSFFRGEEELTLTEVLRLFPDLGGILEQIIEEQYVRKFSIKTLSDRPFGFPH